MRTRLRIVMAFTVATYNILASAYIKPEWYEGVPEQFLRPESRSSAVVNHVEALRADVICLQEVEPVVFSALSGRLGPLGYVGHFEQKGHGKPDGCATFTRRTMFTVRQTQRLEYRDRENGSEKHSGHVALLVAVEREGHVLGIANTHIRWSKPGTPCDEHVGYRQVTELIDACRTFEPHCRDWVICGDFNAAPDTEVIGAVLNAGYAFAHADRPNIRTAVANGRALLIDYVFHTAGLRAKPLDPPAIDDDTKLPYQDQPSDHLGLVAEFDWGEG